MKRCETAVSHGRRLGDCIDRRLRIDDVVVEMVKEEVKMIKWLIHLLGGYTKKEYDAKAAAFEGYEDIWIA